MLPKDITEDVIKRIRIVKGQWGGIKKMLDDGKDPGQVINQFKAAEEALSKAHFLLIDEVFRKGLALQLADVMNACPGNCQEAERLHFLKRNSHNLN